MWMEGHPAAKCCCLRTAFDFWCWKSLSVCFLTVSPFIKWLQHFSVMLACMDRYTSSFVCRQAMVRFGRYRCHDKSSDSVYSWRDSVHRLQQQLRCHSVYSDHGPCRFKGWGHSTCSLVAWRPVSRVIPGSICYATAALSWLLQRSSGLFVIRYLLTVS